MDFFNIVIQHNQRYENGVPKWNPYYTLSYEVVRKSWNPWKWQQEYIKRIPVRTLQGDSGGNYYARLELPTLEQAEACRKDLLLRKPLDRIETQDI